MADVERARLVERHEVAVMFKRVADEQMAITRGWAEVEKAVGSLRGRKFYGVFEGCILIVSRFPKSQGATPSH